MNKSLPPIRIYAPGKRLALSYAEKLLARKKDLLRGYPEFYLIAVSFGGFALFAKSGKHRGSGFGVLYPWELRLYGVWNFLRHDGLAWGKYKYHNIIPVTIFDRGGSTRRKKGRTREASHG